MNSQATDRRPDMDASRQLNGMFRWTDAGYGLANFSIHPGIFLPLIRRFCYMPAIEWASSVKAALGGAVSRAHPP
jgi:hypothetical protein